MIQPIEFRWLVVAEIDGSEYGLMQSVVIKVGTRLSAKVEPYVVASPDGPIEVADLYLEDGSVVRAVRFAAFHFLDGSKCDEAACRESCSNIAEE
jgi:hypothetical protein